MATTKGGLLWLPHNPDTSTAQCSVFTFLSQPSCGCNDPNKTLSCRIFNHVADTVMCSHTIPWYRGRVEIVLYVINWFWQEWSENTSRCMHSIIKKFSLKHICNQLIYKLQLITLLHLLQQKLYDRSCYTKVTKIHWTQTYEVWKQQSH